MMIGDKRMKMTIGLLSFSCFFDWLSWSLETGYVSDCMDDSYYHNILYQKSGCSTQTTNGKGPTPWAGNYTLQVGFLGMYV